MSIKTIIFILTFLGFAGGALFTPVIGIMGYMMHYIIGPESKWWHAPLNPMGMRYSLTLAGLIAYGIIVHRNQLKFEKLLVSQEKLALFFLSIILILVLIGPGTLDRYTITDHPSLKMTKVMIFCFMLTHVITRYEDLDKVFWIIVIGALILGLQAFEMPRRAFTGGRLDGRVGGSDFLDANALAMFMVAASIIIGIMFMKSRWYWKILCAFSGAFALNTVVLCRSRGAFIALMAAGPVILFLGSKRYRLKLLFAGAAAIIGFLYLSDAQFIERMANISKQADAFVSGSDITDRSSEMRVLAWQGGLQMFKDHPFGVGAGNFNQFIAFYSPEIEGLSPHSIYVQAAAELGIFGIITILFLQANALWIPIKIVRQLKHSDLPEANNFHWIACGLGGVVAAYSVFGLVGHHTYSETFWWYLMLPVCLQRSFENYQKDISEGEFTSDPFKEKHIK